MSQKRTDKGGKAQQGKVKFQGFLKMKLNSQEKAHVKENLLDGDGVAGLFMDAVYSGYKLSASYSPEQDVYFVTAYGNRFGMLDAGYALTVRHVDFHTACSAMRWCLDMAGEKGSLTEWLGTEDDDDW